MKPAALFPLATAAIGFAIAWVAKPAEKPSVSPDAAPVSSGTAGNTRAPRADSRSSSAGRKPKEVRAGDFPLADAAGQGPKTSGEGKLGRLTEALGLSVEQQAKIVAILANARSAASDQLPVLQEMAARGTEVEAELKALLTPEQFAGFQEIRERGRDNLVEARAQNLLTPVLERIDLSPEQRQELLARLRLYQREEIQEVPAAATLLLGNSLLPTDPRDPDIEGVLVLMEMEKSGIDPAATPQEAHQRMIRRQKEALERKLECFDGILTAGQMGQYQAFLAEQQRVLEEMRRRAADDSTRRLQEQIERDAAAAPDAEEDAGNDAAGDDDDDGGE